MLCMATHISARAGFFSSGAFTAAKNSTATLRSASTGHALNQSMVVHVTNDGNFRNRSRNASPTGEKHSTTCKFRRTSPKKKLVIASLLPSMPAALARPRMVSKIVPKSPASIKLGTSPVLRMLEISSTKNSWLICVSENRNTVFLFCSPARRMSALKSSCHSCFPYVCDTSIWNTVYSCMYAASFVSDCRPEPPTPTSSAWPPGWLTMRQMRQTCSSANRNSTKRMGFLEVALKSPRYSDTTPCRTEYSVTSSYTLGSAPGTRKSPNMSLRSSLASTEPSPSLSRCWKHLSNLTLGKCFSVKRLIVSKNHSRSGSSVSRSWNTRRDSCTHSLVSASGSGTDAADAEHTIWNTLLTSRRLKV
mmetsp:Transcript_11646/g.49782  ORF Transcript_11646/g.49782 Transcript_11646/m.49782 type:complete len:362 (-) Transcript_11646:1426-2511(-)